MNVTFSRTKGGKERINVNGDVFARQSIQNASGWEDALRNCFRGNITLSFETGKQNRMFISKAAIWALNNPTYVQLLMDAQDLTLLMIGSTYPAPDSIRVNGIGKEPINQYRQEQLARFLEKAGWRKGYRYTLNAITIPIGRQPGLCFDLRKAVVNIPARMPA